MTDYSMKAIKDVLAEFECEVKIDSGLSGHAVIKSK